MFQESEILNLAFAILTTSIVVAVFLRKRLQGMKPFYTGFAFMNAAYIFTVIEGVFYKTFFNLLEHFSLAVSGYCFALGIWQMMQNHQEIPDSKPTEKRESD